MTITACSSLAPQSDVGANLGLRTPDDGGHAQLLRVNGVDAQEPIPALISLDAELHVRQNLVHLAECVGTRPLLALRRSGRAGPGPRR